MKKSVKIFLITIAIFSFLIPPYFTFGYERDGEATASLLQEGEFDVINDVDNDRFVKRSLRKSLAPTAEDFTYNSLLGFPESFDLSDYNIPVDSFSGFYSNVINDNPDLFYVSSSVSYTYYPSTNTVADVYPQYSMTDSEIENAKSIFNEGVDKALSIIDNSMTDIQKAVVIHDYVCGLAHYPDVDLDTQDKDIYHSAYGLFYDGEVVCAGYTLAYSYLMNLCGVPCEYASSDSMGHAWNKVLIGTDWYNVDCTFDDGDFNSSISVNGSEIHSHFLKSDSKFETQICSFHYDGYTGDSCPAENTQYDTAFWDDICSNICAVDGDYYYLKYDGSTHYVYLVKRTESGAETTLKSFRNSVALSCATSAKDRSGNIYQNPYTDPLARITYLDKRFYITVGKNIYSVSTSAQQYTIQAISQFALGIGIDDNRNLIYQSYDNPDTINTLDKMTYFNNHFTLQKGVNYNNYPDINYDGVINAKDYAMIKNKAV